VVVRVIDSVVVRVIDPGGGEGDRLGWW
jgi:hypothetical protein